MTKHLDERSARRAIVATAREIYDRKLSGAADGNLSIRIGADRLLTTPSARHKGKLREEDIVLCDMAGRPVGRGKPSSEIALHTEAYKRRPDAGAVIHAHPPMAIAYSLAGGQLSEVLVSEVVFACGQIATAPYTTPTTRDVPDVLGEYLKCYDVVLMARHGSVTLGPDLETALIRLDALEHTAHIYAAVRMMGGAQPLPAAEVDRLFAIAKPATPAYRQAGCTCPAAEPGASCRGCGGTCSGSSSQRDDAQGVSGAGDAVLIQAVLHTLRGKT